MNTPTVTIEVRKDHPGDGARLARLLARALVEADRRRRERAAEQKETTSPTVGGDYS